MNNFFSKIGYSFFKKYVNKIKELSIDNHIIYTLTNSACIELTLNLIQSFKKLNITNFIIIAIDKLSYEKLTDKNILVIFFNFKELINKEYSLFLSQNYFEILWIKSLIIYSMIKIGEENNIDTLFTDADVVFLKNPYEYIAEKEYDLFLQSLYIRKPEDRYIYDYICELCDTGIVYSKANSNISSIYKKIFYALNNNENINYLDAHALIEIVKENEDKITVSTYYQDNRKKGYINIKILNQYLFPGGETFNSITNKKYSFYIFHANGVKGLEEKIKLLKKTNNWLI